MARILAVGGATVDIINSVNHYPQEDEEIRASSQRITRGGNATNSLTVLQQAGHDCSWAGTLADDCHSAIVVDALKSSGISIRHAERIKHSVTPASYITLNQQTGTRTIVHFRYLPEYSLESLLRINIQDYDWIHLEGRNVDVLTSFLNNIDQTNRPPISLEAEKNRAGIESLFSLVDLVMLSASFRLGAEYTKPEDVLSLFHKHYPTTIASRTAGAESVGLVDRNGQIYIAEASNCTQVIDTVGAGDVFNALLIDGMLSKSGFVKIIEKACYYAGKKCGQTGFNNLLDAKNV